MPSNPAPWRPGAAWRSDATVCLAVAAVLAGIGQALATWQPTELQTGEPGWLLVPVGLQLHQAVLYGAQVGVLVSPAVRRRLAGWPRAAAGAR